MKNWLFLFVGMIFFSCQNVEKPVDAFQHIQDEKVKSILQKSMEKMGGLENWTNKKSLSFEKYFALYDSTGAVENEVDQTHHYKFQPSEKIQIRWKKENNEHLLQSSNNTITKTINDAPDENANPNSLKNTVLSSTFVISLPFKFLDEGVALSYVGQDTLEGGQKVEVLQAIFNPDQHAHHSTPDTWWCYFDAKDFRLEGYMVQHADHFSYVKNLSYEKNNGFTFPKERKSWRVDADRNILYLRADYVYKNYKME